MRLVAFIITIALTSSCSTIATLSGGYKKQDLSGAEAEKVFHCDKNYTIPRVYSGVANDMRFLRGNYQDKGLIFWDLPFSLIADTIVLPYTIYTQTSYGNLCTRDETLDTNKE